MRPKSALFCTVLFACYVRIVTAASCNATNPCPASTPCCSEYGFCGSDTYCLGGCNPFASNTLSSCKPNPVCESATHVFNNNARILTNATFYNGNASEYDWVLDTGNIINTNASGGELGLLLTESNGGTRVSSTRYVHYGSITARLKTGRWAGVVTAFITMSDIKDEIDWEFPGNNTSQGQTNYFWQGLIPLGRDNGNITGGLQDTYGTYHNYTIDWKQDALTWLVDGNVVRTVNKTSTIDSYGIAHYPTTPSRMQLSLWPAGINTSAPGTIAWAGGMINWNDPDYQSAGHFYALVESVTVQCDDPTPAGPNVTSYVYLSNNATDVAIGFSNASTLENSAPRALLAQPGSVQVGLAIVVVLISGAQFV